MKIQEIREQTIKELQAKKRDLSQEIFNLRIQQSSGQLERPHMLRQLRRQIARIETVITEKSRAAKETAKS